MEEILTSNLQLRKNKLIEDLEKAKACLSAEIITHDDLIVVRTALKHTLEQFSAELNTYIEKVTNPNVDITKAYFLEQMKAEDVLVQINTLQNHYKENKAANSMQNYQARLPKLDIGKYDGNILEWNSFWDKFQANVDSRNISDVEKFSYLLSSLEGTAYEAVEGLGTTNVNYSIAVDILKLRFGEQQKVIDAHNKALYALNTAISSASSCRQTLNAIEKHLRVLECLGEDTNGSHLRVIILSKFPENVLYQTSLLTVNNTSVAAIRTALDTVVTALERSTLASTSNPTPATTSTSNPAPATTPTSTETLHVRIEGKREQRKRKHPEPAQKKRETIKKSRPTIKKCTFCGLDNHYSEDCQKYRTFKDRKLQLKDKCYLCFRSGHLASKCTAKILCRHCSKKHNRAMCYKKVTAAQAKGDTASSKETPRENVSSFFTKTQNFLQTAVTQVRAKDKTLQCRILLDSGSQRTYMTANLASKLNIIPDDEDHLTIYTFGSNKPKEIKSSSTEVTLITKRNIERKIRVNIVPHITDRIPVINVGPLQAVDILADDNSTGESIDILIGNDLYFSFLRTERFRLKDQAYLVDSDFGWIIAGNFDINHDKRDVLSIITYCHCHETVCPYFTEPDLPLRNIDMRFLWSLESIGILDSPKSTREEEVVKYFNETTVYRNGRYEIKWPWIQYPPDLPTNFGLAFGRLRSLLTKLDKDSLAEYNKILQEQLDSGIIEVIKPLASPMTQVNPPVHYLPHHMVKQKGKAGRLVYDASAKVKNQKGLNECLYAGPSMLEDLTGLLLKFRTRKIGITADIEKAFLQVGLQEEDRDVTRFLWVKDPSKDLTENNLIHLRFCRVPFGIISSPFLLTATIRHHIAQTDKTLLSQIADKCYVDNLVLAVDSEEEALELYNKVRKVLGEISMNIRDWMSNNTYFMENISEGQRAKQTEVMKILGLNWNMKQDSLLLNMDKITDCDGDRITKRDVLRIVARLYDPNGFVSPLVLPAKLIFQELCNRKSKWDDLLPEDLKDNWMTALNSLKTVTEVNVPRYIKGSLPDHEKVEHELHCFCDASKDAYAAVVYLRMMNKHTAKTAFLMSKARITPSEDKEDLKIPRLELLAYLIGNRLLRYVRGSLDITISRQVLWTDSLIVLSWLKSNKLLPPFVQRRVNEIRQTKEVEHRYVNTKLNPADVATRPELWLQKRDLWFNGPTFLQETNEDHWPKTAHIIEGDAVCLAGEILDIGEGPEMTTRGYEQEKEDHEPMDSQEFSEQKEMESVDVEENLQNIKDLQKQYFPDEVTGKETSLKRNLDLFFDVDGVLRCRGRLSNANWTYDKRYPILIPKNSTFTEKVIQKVHETNYHVGISHTLSIIREKYWIPQGRAQVQKILKKCPQCVKFGGGPYSLPPAPVLPPERVNYSKAFTFSGLDYLGPIQVETNGGLEKRWVCLFTCLAVRAVHLEVVKDLTAEECLLAIRRFVATRGSVQIMFSDNALQFKLTSEVLSSSFCKEMNIRWKFITQLAPWQGGFYERLVALVKHCMKRTLDKHLLKDNQLQTVVKEIEAVINTRPLTTVGSDLEEILRPADFLTLGKCLEMNPTFTDSTSHGTSTKVDLVKGWKRGQMIIGEYKDMFMNQYLPSLRERYSHMPKQPRVKSHEIPQIGAIVQIRDDSKNRARWKTGKIVSLIKGQDGQCRSAKVKVGNCEFTRSIAHLYPLEMEVFENAVPSKNRLEAGEGITRVDFPNTLPSDIPMIEALHVPRESAEVHRSDECTIKGNVNSEEEVAENPATPELPLSKVNAISDSLESLQLFPNEEDEVERQDLLPAEESVTEESNVKRRAAIRAREKIAEWTRQLLILLQ